MNIGELRKLIGQAIYMVILLQRFAAKSENAEWLLVAEGRIVSDTEMAWWLGCSEATSRRWRLDLEYAGLLESVRGRGGNVLRLRNFEKLESQAAARAEQPKAQTSTPGQSQPRWVQ